MKTYSACCGKVGIFYFITGWGSLVLFGRELVRLQEARLEENRGLVLAQRHRLLAQLLLRAELLSHGGRGHQVLRVHAKVLLVADEIPRRPHLPGEHVHAHRLGHLALLLDQLPRRHRDKVQRRLPVPDSIRGVTARGRLVFHVGRLAQLDGHQGEVVDVVLPLLPAPPAAGPAGVLRAPAGVLECLPAGEQVEHLEDVLPEELDLLGVDGGRALQQQRRLGKVDSRRPAVQRDVQLGELLDVVLEVPERIFETQVVSISSE